MDVISYWSTSRFSKLNFALYVFVWLSFVAVAVIVVRAEEVLFTFLYFNSTLVYWSK
ncbi:hypothetical protein [Mesomycoplasma hyorhinis]|uniref:hypothetical protein n=1 Tax=Mesomycoplasma hyorhinis TaxID=2100 RepID=UPI001F3BB2D8|nr:hypothetical protein [Mesomycoplasma hyorhinis]